MVFPGEKRQWIITFKDKGRDDVLVFDFAITSNPTCHIFCLHQTKKQYISISLCIPWQRICYHRARSIEVVKKSPVTYIRTLFRLTYLPTLAFKLFQWSRRRFSQTWTKTTKAKKTKLQLSWNTLPKSIWTHKDIKGCKFRIPPQNYIAMKTDTIRWIS